MVVKVKRETLEACMICPLCHKLLKDATTISLCLHTFCRKCIHEKLSDEEMDCCPVCNIDLGCLPVEKLRPDHNLQDIRSKIFPFKRKKITTQEVVPSISLPAKRKERSLSSLVASDDQKGDVSLPQISECYFRIKDGTLPVSFTQKYLVKKLNLAHVNASNTVFAPPISHSHPPQQTQTQTMHPVTVTEAETDDEDSIPLSLILRERKQSTTSQIPQLKSPTFVYPFTSNIPQPDKPQTLTPEPTPITEPISTSEPNPETETSSIPLPEPEHHSCWETTLLTNNSISQSPSEQLQEFIRTMLSESSSDDSQPPSPVSPPYETPLAVIYNNTDSATVTSAEKLADETEVVSEPEPFSPFLHIVPYSPIVISLPHVPPVPVILNSPNPIPPNPMQQILQNELTNIEQEFEMVKEMEKELRREAVTIACLENYWNEWNSKELHIQFIADWYESHRHRQSNINRRLKLAASWRSPSPPLAEWIM